MNEEKMYHMIFLMEVAESERGSKEYYEIIKTSLEKNENFTEENKGEIEKIRNSKCSCCGKNNLLKKPLSCDEDVLVRVYSPYRSREWHYICDDCLAEGTVFLDKDENLVTYDYFEKNEDLELPIDVIPISF